MRTYLSVMTPLRNRKLHRFEEKVAPDLYTCVLFWCVKAQDHDKTATAPAVRIGQLAQAES